MAEGKSELVLMIESGRDEKRLTRSGHNARERSMKIVKGFSINDGAWIDFGLGEEFDLGGGEALADMSLVSGGRSLMDKHGTW